MLLCIVLRLCTFDRNKYDLFYPNQLSFSNYLSRLKVIFKNHKLQAEEQPLQKLGKMQNISVFYLIKIIDVCISYFLKFNYITCFLVEHNEIMKIHIPPKAVYSVNYKWIKLLKRPTKFWYSKWNRTPIPVGAHSILYYSLGLTSVRKI